MDRSDTGLGFGLVPVLGQCSQPSQAPVPGGVPLPDPQRTFGGSTVPPQKKAISVALFLLRNSGSALPLGVHSFLTSFKAPHSDNLLLAF